jgi:hypothetical protein
MTQSYPLGWEKSQKLSYLESLNVENTKVTAAGVRELKRARPKLKIVR